MCRIATIIITLFFSVNSFSQNFLKDYFKQKKYQIDTSIQEGLISGAIPNQAKAKKWGKKRTRLLKDQIKILDTIFNFHAKRYGFNFNTADSIFFINEQNLESGINHYMIWSGRDTLSFAIELENIAPYKFVNRIAYKPYLSENSRSNGYKIINERDSLVFLVSKKDSNTLSQLGKGQIISDGSFYNVIFGAKEAKHFTIKELTISPFYFKPIYRKE